MDRSKSPIVTSDHPPFGANVKLVASQLQMNALNSLRTQMLEFQSRLAGINSLISGGHTLSETERSRTMKDIRSFEEFSSFITDHIRQAEAAYRASQDVLRALRWSTSIIRRIPDEILGEIFECYVLEMKKSPWVLTKVSRSWRRVAFANRRIWTRLQLDYEGASYVRRFEGRQLCTTVAELKAALLRSGHAPLDIVVEHCSAAMALVLVSECRRWESFTYWELDDEVSRVLLDIPQAPTNLKSAMLRIKQYCSISQWLAQAQPTSLHIVNSDLDKFQKISSWPQLRELRVEFAHESFDPSPSIIPLLNSASRQLTYLELEKVQIEGNQILHPLMLPGLLELKLNNVSFWWKFQCDNLTKLCLLYCLPPPQNVTVSFPSLQVLDYDCKRGDLKAGSFVTPRLCSLTIRHVYQEFPPLVFSGSGQGGKAGELKNLSLVACHIPLRKMELALSTGCQGLETLQLVDWRLPFTFFKNLGSAYPVVCPKLQKLLVDMSWFNGKIEESKYVDVFRGLVAIRNTRRAPLQSVLVSWPKKSSRPTEDFANSIT